MKQMFGGELIGKGWTVDSRGEKIERTVLYDVHPDGRVLPCWVKMQRPTRKKSTRTKP